MEGNRTMVQDALLRQHGSEYRTTEYGSECIAKSKLAQDALLSRERISWLFPHARRVPYLGRLFFQISNQSLLPRAAHLSTCEHKRVLLFLVGGGTVSPLGGLRSIPEVASPDPLEPPCGVYSMS